MSGKSKIQHEGGTMFFKSDDGSMYEALDLKKERRYARQLLMRLKELEHHLSMLAEGNYFGGQELKGARGLFPGTREGEVLRSKTLREIGSLAQGLLSISEVLQSNISD